MEDHPVNISHISNPANNSKQPKRTNQGNNITWLAELIKLTIKYMITLN